MPFTVSHVAAVLPLRRLALPIAALAIGAMVPDLPLFAPWWSYSFSHSVIGLGSVDLAVGLVCTVLWWVVFRPPALDAMPDAVRDRFPARPRLGLRTVALAAVGVGIGAATHVGWDEFTHEGRWGERHVPWLATKHWGVGGVHWAQAVSSIAGLGVVLAAAVMSWRATARRPRPRILDGFAIPAVGGIAIVSVVVAAIAAARSTGGLHGAAFDAVSAGVPAASGATVVAVSAWWARTWRSSPQGPAG